MREGEMDPGLYDFRPYRDRAKDDIGKGMIAYLGIAQYRVLRA